MMRSVLLAACGISSAFASTITRKSDVVDFSKNAGTTHASPVATLCGPSSAKIVCINRYGSVLPPSFSRDPNPVVGYSGTKVPDDPSWEMVATADFVVFDQKRGLELLGPSPRIEKMFDVLNVIHEGPVYVPAQNKLYVAQAGPPGNLSQLVVDLNVDPPTLKTFETSPPTYQPNGGVLHEGMIYWTVLGNNDSLPNGLVQRPSIARLDPATGKVETLLNNYFGFSFAGPNDITVDKHGDIWFTDNDYSYGLGLSPSPPQIQLATYRFRPSTGEVAIVEDTLNHPNGISFSPDGKTLYITDSSLESVGKVASRGQGDFYNYPIKIDFISTNKRNIYAYDVNNPCTSSDGGNPYLTNKRVIFQALEGAPDGFKVAANGFLVVASGLATGVDILDARGTPVARIQTKHAVENFAWTGKELKTLWLVGIGGFTKVEFELKGPAL